jgi:hypothetical protein
MKKALLIGVAALFLATGATAQQGNLTDTSAEATSIFTRDVGYEFGVRVV